MEVAKWAPSTNELFWAAGFLEGEGSFSSVYHQGNSRSASFIVNASQKVMDTLVMLQCFFGGNIRLVKRGANNFLPSSEIYEWTVNGGRARGVAMTLYSLMSPRRKLQIRKMLDKHWRPRG